MTAPPSVVLRDVLWVEKHRPATLEALGLELDTRTLLASYLAAGEVPHLLLVGPPGSGKTTLARIVVNTLDCRWLVLNASDERGIDTVRSKIGTFVTSMLGGRWNIVFLDEADAMTSDAQTALRNLIEAHADRSRFILTANYSHRVIPAVQSRCQVITLAAPPLKERVRILSAVLTAEGIAFEPMTALSYAERYTDMRRMLMAAQRGYLSNGKGALPLASETKQVSGVDVWQYVLSKNWTGLRWLTTSGDFDPQQALRELFYAIPDEHPRCGQLRHIVGRAVHDSGFTPDPPVLFLATCAEAMEAL